MFRFKNKKPRDHQRRIGTTQDEDNDEDEDDQQQVMIRQQQRSKSKLKKNVRITQDNANRNVSSTGTTNAASRTREIMPSFGTLEDDEEEEELTMGIGIKEEKKNKKSKRKRMGYGGLSVADDEVDDDSNNNNNDNVHRYDREALSKLKSEQKSMDDRQREELLSKEPTAISGGVAAAAEVNEKQVQTQADDRGEVFSNFNHTPGADQQQQQQRQPPSMATAVGGGNPENDYIPMNRDSKRTKTEAAAPTILTGDEALRMAAQEHPGETLNEAMDVSPPKQEHDEALDEPAAAFTSEWEAEVTRRAGLTTTNTDSSAATIATSNTSAPGMNILNTDNNAHLSLTDLRRQFAATRKTLFQQAQDLDRLRERRLTESEAAQAEYKQRQERAQQTGKALEFYQAWRYELVSWVGALRELQEKMSPLQQAFDDLEHDISALDAWKDWEDDFIFELWQAGRLDQVVGRQPDAALFTTTVATQDEFGRNVKSQQVMARERRVRHRMHIQGQRKQRNDALADEHAHTSDEELEVLRERHVALQKALAVALEQVDSEYTSLQHLVDFFGQWQQAYPEEYEECYASLTLADLGSVLVSTEMIGSLNDPWNESGGYNEAKWTGVVHSASIPKSTRETVTAVTTRAGGVVLDGTGIERLVEKAVLPAISSLLGKSGYNLVSERQTKSLTNFLRYVQKILVPRLQDQDRDNTTLGSTFTTSAAHVAVAPVNGDDFPSNQSRRHHHHHHDRGSQMNSSIGGGSISIDRSPVLKSLHKCVIAYIRQYLDGIAMPIIGSATNVQTPQETDQEVKITSESQKQQLADALQAARVGQLHRIRTVLVHLLKYWAPLLRQDDSFAETVLYFCSAKLLVFLSSLNGLENEGAVETSSTSSSSSQSLGFMLWSPTDVFRQIWELLQAQEGWMDRPEWMVQTITLRAAANAYGITTST